MFGESDSESPRVPSPWDSLTSTPSTPATDKERFTRGIPRLVPEAEEGNVEYKLQLLSPSPARFARLVTQLKWRLLEGGGQAYYELGVADSGALIGLPRQELEGSLETLEMMAGEIGASVIVVKEVEVPTELSEVARLRLEQWEGRPRHKKGNIKTLHDDPSPTTSTTDIIDAEENCYSADTSAQFEEGLDPLSILQTFTMDSDWDMAAPDKIKDRRNSDSMVHSIDLEIASVYKPRPTRKLLACMVSGKLGHVDGRSHHGQGEKGPHQPPRPHKPLHGKRRDVKHDTLLTHLTASLLPSDLTPPPTLLAEDHASPNVFPIILDPVSHQPSPAVHGDGEHPHNVTCKEERLSGVTMISSNEPRLIVEALVVRKLSLNEAYLDFGGFSLD